MVLVDGADEWFSYLPTNAAPQLQAQLGLDYSRLGVLLVLLPAGGILGQAALVAADFVSRRLLASLGALTYAGCLAAFALGDSFVVLAVASFVWGAASDAFVHGAGLALADLAGDDLDATLAGKDLLGSLGTLASPASVAVAAAIGIGYRPLFGGAAVVMVLFALWLARQPLPPPPDSGHTPISGLRATVGDARVWRMAALLVPWDAIEVPFLGFAAATLVARSGITTATAALVVGTWTVGAIVAYAAMTRWPPQGEQTMRAAAIVRIVAMVALAVFTDLWVAAVAALVVGVSGAMFWVPYQSAVLRLRPDQRGTTWAVIALISIPGLLIAPLFGAIADAAGATLGLLAFAVMPLAAWLVMVSWPAR